MIFLTTKEMNRIRIYLILDGLDTIQNLQELNASTNSFHLLI